MNLLIRSEGSWSGRERNVCYANNGDGSFTDEAFVSGLDLNSDGRAFAPLDLDGDGDLDLVLKNRSGTQLRAFRNDWQSSPESIAVRLEGRQASRDAVGALLTLETDRRRLLRHIASGSGYLSQRPRTAHFGLEPGEEPIRLHVAWPGGPESTYEDLPADARRWNVVQGEPEVQTAPAVAPRERRSEPTPAPSGPGVRLATAVPAPGFELADLDGAPVSLAASGGRKTLINFWATWCPPCRAELADLVEHAEQLERAGVRVLAVSVDEPAELAAVRAFADEFRVPFPVLPASDEVVNAFTVLQHNLFDRRTDLAIPTSFLVDEAGDVITVYRGETDAATILRDLEGGSAYPFEGRWVRGGVDRDFVALGASYAERGLIEPAIGAFERAWNAGVRSPELSNNFAGALLQAGELGRAETLLRDARQAAPQDQDLALNLASVALAQDAYAEAYELASNVVAARADDAAAHTILGSAAFAQGRQDEAESSFRRAIELDAALPDAHQNLAGLLASSGRLDAAIESYETAVELGASSAGLYSNLGTLFMMTGAPARGLEAFQKAVELDSRDYGANLNLALYFARSGDPSQAREWAEKARRIDPEQPAAYLLGAEAAAASGDVAAARSLLEELLRRDPSSSAAQQALDRLGAP